MHYRIRMLRTIGLYNSNPNTAGVRTSKNMVCHWGFSRTRAVASSQWGGIFQVWAFCAPVLLIFSQSLYPWKTCFPIHLVLLISLDCIYLSVVFIMIIDLCRGLQLGCLYVDLEAIIYIPNYLMNQPIYQLKRLGILTGIHYFKIWDTQLFII